MLIEASRGGHANVANLLLRQPRHMPRKLPSPEPTPQSNTTTTAIGAERKGLAPQSNNTTTAIGAERKGLARNTEHSRPLANDQVCY